MHCIRWLGYLLTAATAAAGLSPLTTTVITAGIELPGLLGIEVRIAAAPDARIEGVRQHLAGSIELVAIAVIAPAGW